MTFSAIILTLLAALAAGPVAAAPVGPDRPAGPQVTANVLAAGDGDTDPDSDTGWGG